MSLLQVPFPHTVIDNFLPLPFADRIYKELKNWEVDEKFYKYDNVFEKKFACDKFELFPPNVKHFMMSTLTSPFVSMIEKQIGIEGLIADPWIRGGGFHCHLPGGKLDVHRDFVFHEKLKLWRRVNAIWFANKMWDTEWKGDLELWNSDMTQCVRKISPKFNRLVIFETPNAPHGLPEPINCPENHRRMSLACYFYSVEKPDEIGEEKTSTMFLKRPEDVTDEAIEQLREKRNKGRLSSNV